MKIIPYLYFNGNAEEALKFYQSVFGGEIPMIQRYSEGPEGMPVPDNYDDKIMHGRLAIGDVLIYVSDYEYESGPTPHSLSVEFDDAESLQKAYDLMQERAEVKFELQDTFWGAKYAKLTDEYGISWDLNYQYPQDEA